MVSLLTGGQRVEVLAKGVDWLETGGASCGEETGEKTDQRSGDSGCYRYIRWKDRCPLFAVGGCVGCKCADG
jgi:hypothetical protein